ncbi:MAG: hypothetical protein ABJE95_26800 [Byssovorax sp.]
MNILRLLGAASSAIALLSACTTSTPAETSGPGGAGGTSASSSATSSGTGGSGGAESTSAAWSAAAGRSFGKVALAAAGSEGAVAYVESGAPDSNGVFDSIIKLQRLDASGAVRGAAVDLGQVTSSADPSVTLASDGSRYLACWDDAKAGKIACALAPAANGASVPALALPGLWPSLVYSAGAWTMAYGSPGHAAIAHVSDDGQALGTPTLFSVTASLPPRTLVAVTAGGFVLVSAPDFDTGTTTLVHLLDGAFEPLGAPIDLGMKRWLRDAVALAVNGPKIAVSIPEPYGSHLFVLEGGAIASMHSINFASKGGPEVALTADGTSFGELEQADGPGPLNYVTLAGDALIATPQAPESDLPLMFSYSTIDLTRIGDHLLFAATVGQLRDGLIVARVHRP